MYFRLDQLVDSNSARLESMKAQQMDFQQRLDSFEHIQRLSRNTLDELKGETDKVQGPRDVRELKYKRRNRSKMNGNRVSSILDVVPFTFGVVMVFLCICFLIKYFYFFKHSLINFVLIFSNRSLPHCPSCFAK